MTNTTFRTNFPNVYGIYLLLCPALLLTACRPFSPTAAQPTPSPIAPADAPTPPQTGVHFPVSSEVLPPVAVQPAAPAAPAPPTATPTPELINGPVTVAVDAAVPEEWAGPLLSVLNKTADVQTFNGVQPLRVLDQTRNAAVQVALRPLARAQAPVAERIFAVVAPFATVRDDVSFAELQQRWREPSAGGPLFVHEQAAPLLSAILGKTAHLTATMAAGDCWPNWKPRQAVWASSPSTCSIPRFKVLTVDGVNVLSNRFDPNVYPLAVALTVEGRGGVRGTAAGSRPRPAGHQSRSKPLTQLIMTGVTAMSRGTAADGSQRLRLSRRAHFGYLCCGRHHPHLQRSAVSGRLCGEPAENNLILCSRYRLLGGAGGHGRGHHRPQRQPRQRLWPGGAQRSIGCYREQGIPIYGSGITVDEACAPLFWEHNGNTFAFIAALAFDPPGAWASADQPGACYYYENKDASWP